MAATTLTVQEGYYGPDFFDDLFQVNVSYSANPSSLLAPEDFPKPSRDDKADKKYTIGGDKLESIKKAKIDEVLTAALGNAKSFRERVSRHGNERYGMHVGELNGYRMLIIRIDALAASFFAHISSFRNPKLPGGQEVVLKDKDVLKDQAYYEERMRSLLDGKKELEKLIDQKPGIGRSSASKLLAKMGEALAASR